MGNYNSAFNISNNEPLKQDRLIDAENKIYIGIVPLNYMMNVINAMVLEQQSKLFFS